MEINKSNHMGFCFGVKNAVDNAVKELDINNKLYSYGEIIHNMDVIDFLSKKGLQVIDYIPEKINGKLLIRSHGVGKNIIESLEQNNIDYIDATCVKVKRIHKLVEEYSKNGYEIVVIGDSSHPEVIGIIGWIDGIYHVANSLDDVKNINFSRDKKYCLVCQTTFYNNIFKEIVEFLKNNDYTNIVIHNTICNATQKRQEACIELAKKSDVMLIIGGKNSSNTLKLYELSKKYCDKTYYIENYREIPYKNIDKNTKVGISAGASTPDWIIEEVIQYVRKSEYNNE